MSRHRVHADSFPNSGKLIVDGEEAHHALRTRRLGVGDSLDVLDGRGRVAAESGKQCGRPWFLEIQEPVRLPEALATVACFAEHTMRIETAAIVALGVILDQERRAAPPVTQPVSSAERNAP